VQGVVFTHDHCAVEPLGDGSDGVRVTIWNDNPAESPPGRREAQVWTILPVAPSRRHGGVLNTRQYRVVYAERPTIYARWEEIMPVQNTELRDWVEFVPPPEAITRHGVWMNDAAWDRHVGERTRSGWGD
jgi:hypothetical protein